MPRRKGTISTKIAADRGTILEMADWMAANCTKPCWINTSRPDDWARAMRADLHRLQVRYSARQWSRGYIYTPRDETHSVNVVFRSDDDFMLFQLRWDRLMREFVRLETENRL